MKPLGIRVPLLVSDFDAAIDFYCHVAALFDLDHDGKFGSDWNRNTGMTFRHPTYTLGLSLCYAEPEALVQVQQVLAARSRSNYVLHLPVEHCWEEYYLMSKRGVQFEGEPLDLPWGVQSSFRDPFGNRIILFEDYWYMSTA